MADRAATSVLFGFDFQANAAIILMLENIREMAHIRLEGSEDIEITLNDGSHIFAQAKSVVNSSSDFKNVLANLKKSIESLSEANHNASNSFNSLPAELQGIISEILNKLDNPLDINKFKIQILPFETDNFKERYKFVIAEIGDFISLLGNFPIERSLIHKIWANDLFRSGTRKDQNINLKKKDLIWPIIVLITDNEDYDEYDIDDSDTEELLSSYRDIINTCSEKYEFVTRVLNAYNSFNAGDNRTKLEKFIKSESQNFKYLFDDANINLSEDLQIILLQIIIRNIISKRRRINHIKNTVNL